MEYLKQHLKQKTDFYAQLKKYLPSDKDSRILDLGCSKGQFVNYLNELGYTNVLGLDSDKLKVDFCFARSVENVMYVDVFEFLRNDTKTYDLFILSHFLEHLDREEIEEIFKLMSSKLKNGGSILIITPNMASFNGLYYRYMDYTHKIGFTATSLQHVLKSYFTYSEVTSMDMPAISKSRAALLKLISPIFNLTIKTMARVYWPSAVSKESKPILVGVAKKWKEI